MKKFIYITLIFISFLNLSPNFVYAINSPIDTSYTTISKSDIPGVAPGGTVSDVSKFLPAVFQLGIGIAGILAVIYIIVGGIQYLSSDAINNKSAGRERIQNALWGLLLAISAYAILSTINPNLVNLNLSIAVLPQGGAISNNLGTTTPNPGAAGSRCSNCVVATGFPAKSPAQNGCSTDPVINPAGVCVVAPQMMTELQKIAQAMNVRNWQVTEMYPPTVYHIDPCHSNGTCVDATVADTSVSSLATFFKAIEASGASSYTYEVCDLVRQATLKKDPAFSGLRVVWSCPSSNTGESVHINM